MVKKNAAVRWRKRLRLVQISSRLRLVLSTVTAVLVRCWNNWPRYIGRVTGEKIRRYERRYPGSSIHRGWHGVLACGNW